MSNLSKKLRRAFEIWPFCNYCGVELSYLVYGANYATIDHIKGRSNSNENLTLCCLSCNSKKGNSKLWKPKFSLVGIFFMANDKNWHKRWTRRQDGRLQHESGLIVEKDDGLGLTTDDSTFDVWQAYELSRGVTLENLRDRLQRLLREAGEWRDE